MNDRFLVGARCVFALLFVVVTWLTITPNPENTESSIAIARWIASMLFKDSSLGDKVAHFGAYALLGAAAFYAHFTFPKAFIITPLALGGYGAFLEFMQGLGGVRTPELADAVANGCGAIAGFFGAYLLARTMNRAAQ